VRLFMQMHTIRPKHRARRARRVGRGGKRGTFSGRGMKGQRSRAGAKLRPAIRDFIKSVPKLRGEEFPAMPKKERSVTINLSDLHRAFVSGGQVTPKTLAKAGLLPSSKMSVKLLARGDAPKGLLVRGVPVSQSARRKIEGAGGSVQA